MSENHLTQSCRNIITRNEKGLPINYTPEALQALRIAAEYADRYEDADTGMVLNDYRHKISEIHSIYAVITFMLLGEPDRIARAKRILSQLDILHDKFSINMTLLAVNVEPALFAEPLGDLLKRSVKAYMDSPDEEIIAGRNINLPLQTWTVRIAGGIMFGRQDLLDGGRNALERLTDLAAAHGDIPEFNSPTYHTISMQMLRIISLLGEPTTASLAKPLEAHLWKCFAWRWHPRVCSLAGPWSRAYHDTLAGLSGNTQALASILWGAPQSPEIAYQYIHAHDHLYYCGMVLLADSCPLDMDDIATRKSFPITVKSASEQTLVHMGGDTHTNWVPGGIAELTTWMDTDMSVGTATRSHLHGMQNGTYIAQWSRTGKPVEKLADFGQAFTHFIQNGTRPGQDLYRQRHHHRNVTMEIGKMLWPDNGRPFVLQSGPTALVLYQPKGQERWYVKRLEAAVVLPRLDTIDTIWIDGKEVTECEKDTAQTVLIKSGQALMGLRFTPCDSKLCSSTIFIERINNHLLAGIRLVDFPEERELHEMTYRRYGASIGMELRVARTDVERQAFQEDLDKSVLADKWWMAVQGGPREVSFEIAGKRIWGRFDPISESWTRRSTPVPPGECVLIQWEP